ncbi:hypothetical protein [Rhodovulum sp. FJ3]|uniref:hypothetical protein n=1 Tax=Rhodovulum sp. FJ3 TaxID=3079053 RepID=UPI00293DAA36|nr:hypothetical protein [Rhodovulum sp. FJ3]MDV4168225.1 hypothetical protein [Rhodovulum sp. FJ3]
MAFTNLTTATLALGVLATPALAFDINVSQYDLVRSSGHDMVIDLQVGESTTIEEGWLCHKDGGMYLDMLAIYEWQSEELISVTRQSADTVALEFTVKGTPANKTDFYTILPRFTYIRTCEDYIQSYAVAPDQLAKVTTINDAPDLKTLIAPVAKVFGPDAQ